MKFSGILRGGNLLLIRHCARIGDNADAAFVSANVLLALLLGLTGYVVGISQFSPDSWAYFELAKSVFSGDFYSFNTFRSYYSESHSTSFPLGYPVLVSVAMLPAGEHPQVAVAINVVAAIVSFNLIWGIAKRLGLSRLGGFLAGLSLLLFPRYLEEVFSGRAVPVAILFFLAAFYVISREHYLFGGLLLGFSALVKFEYLVYAAVSLGGLVLIKGSGRKQIMASVAGFVMGISPWALYSYNYFGKFWVSDNSWVALSAVPAYNADFPAKAVITAAEAPALWVSRILGNVIPLLISIAKASIRFPAILFFGVAFLATYEKVPHEHRMAAIKFMLLLAVSVAPYLLTGYFDQRYFSLILICGTMALIYFVEHSSLNDKTKVLYGVFALVPLVLSVSIGGKYLATSILSGAAWAQNDRKTEALVRDLSRCHSRSPEETYIFAGEVGRLAPRYGAVTGHRTAFLPSNFDRMNGEEKAEYLAHMSPYRMIENMTGGLECKN